MDAMRSRIRVFLLVLFSVMAIGVLGFMRVEGLSLGDAIYFSIVTVSTVGYGDVIPRTQIGKMLAALLIIGGTGSFLGIVATATEMFITKREKLLRLEKVNMLIEAFFSDVGTELLTILSDYDPNLDRIREELIVEGDWTASEFSRVVKSLGGYDYEVDINRVDLKHLKGFLSEKRNFLLRLLENPMLLEHESFSELLRAVFHFTEELTVRKDLRELPKTDLEHIIVDIKRVYSLLALQWAGYMMYLKDNYPYLFSFAMRTNPFDEKVSPIVGEAK
jgi:hypothetical protein